MPELEIPELTWTRYANCRGMSPELFFPPPGGDERTPLMVCRGCAVRLACLAYALDAEERNGVWGGTTQRQRRRLLRNRAKRLREAG